MFRNTRPTVIGDNEFIALMALLMSLVALAIDTMLPALAVIGGDLGVINPNHNQLIISVIFFGVAIGQLLYGPLSDSIGRKPAIYIGIGIFMLGSIMSLFATNFPVMLAGRLLQGLGIAGPRIVMMALIRDKYEGREMAKVMSFVITLFILAPTIAPAIGQIIISFGHWRAIFAFFLLLSVISMVWLAIRQPETLVVEKRIPLSLSRVLSAIREVCSNRIAIGYTLTNGFLSGLFLVFLTTSPQILQEQYELGVKFPIYFAALSIAVGLTTFLNGKIVMRFGMRILCHRALYILFAVSLLYCLPAFNYNGHPPLWTFMGYLILCFFAIGFVFGNLNALAMQPLGHIAGVGAAVIGSLSTLMSLPIGIYIGHSYNGTILPLVMGFLGCSLACIVLVIWTEHTADATVKSDLDS
ncbi:MAG: multidrug effflux MFS transporter [Gammaproteobacteria bacterium]|jgi:MFS transporter, DHA1 family, multidrug resistance protein|nr:multidrug effflux MFS transporter [Gammaproteobacteria bacterium]